MTDAIWIILGIVLLALVFGAGRMFSGQGAGADRKPSELPQTSAADLDQLALEVAPLIARQRKIDAIKLVRERTGWGLKEAKDWVECL